MIDSCKSIIPKHSTVLVDYRTWGYVTLLDLKAIAPDFDIMRRGENAVETMICKEVENNGHLWAIIDKNDILLNNLFNRLTNVNILIQPFEEVLIYRITKKTE